MRPVRTAPLARGARGCCAAPRRCIAAPAAPARGRLLVARAIESYMVDKLRAAEQTYKELSLRMADPEVAANSNDFQKVRAPVSAAAADCGLSSAVI